MSPPAAAIVVGVVATVAVGVAFKHFIYEPYLAPKLEAWAEAYALHRREVRRRRERGNRQTASRESLVLSTPFQSHEDISRPGHHRGLSSSTLSHSVSSVELENVGKRDRRADASVGSLGASTDGAEMRNRRGFSSKMDHVDKPVPPIPYDSLKPTYVVADASAPTTPGEELGTAIPLVPAPRSRPQSATSHHGHDAGPRPRSTAATDSSTLRASRTFTPATSQAAGALGMTGAATNPAAVIYSPRAATSHLAAAASVRATSPNADMDNSIYMSQVYPSPSISSSDSLGRSRSGAGSPVNTRADSIRGSDRGGSATHSRAPSQVHSRAASQTLSNSRSSISADSPIIDLVPIPRSPFSDSLSFTSVPSRTWSEVDVEESRSNRAGGDAASPTHVSRPASSATGGPFVDILSDEEFEITSDTGSWHDIRR